MIGYTIDHEALAYCDSMRIHAGYNPHDALDAVLILTDLTNDPAFKRGKFCWWCENWDSRAHMSARMVPKKDQHGAEITGPDGKPVLHQAAGLWQDEWNRPARRGAEAPMEACSGCVLAKLDEEQRPDPEPLTRDERFARYGVQIATLEAQIAELRGDKRWQGRVASLESRRDQLAKSQHHLQAQMEIASGKRRVLVQFYSPLRGVGHSCVPEGPAEEHWETVADWDAAGVGSNVPAKLNPGEQVMGAAPRVFRASNRFTVARRPLAEAK